MSATRTQVYLTTAQRQRIDEIASAEGMTMAEVVRRAIDAYVLREGTDITEALRSTFGADPTIDVPPRSEWDRAHG